MYCQCAERKRVAPRAGFEPATNWLTANCSTTELPRNNSFETADITELAVRAKMKNRQTLKVWRPRPESNRGTRLCRPLRHHSATWPSPIAETIAVVARL